MKLRLHSIFLSLLLLPATGMAEHNGTFGLGGRPTADFNSGSNNLENLLGACSVKRPGAVVPIAAAAAAAVGTAGTAAVDPKAALFQAKCLVCHNPLPEPKDGRDAISNVANGLMPPPGNKQRITINETQKQQILEFLTSGNSIQ